MKKITDSIIEILKQELDQNNLSDNYSQWVLGVSIRKERVIGKPIYTARVVVKTSESIYVDGMDIIFMVPEEDVIMEASLDEYTPTFRGGTVEAAIKWLEQVGEINYLQLTNPYKLDIYLSRLESIISKYPFTDLMEYTLDSKNGTNLSELYQDLIQKTIQESVDVDGKEISDGKYELKIIVRDKEYYINSKAWYAREDIIEEIKNNVLIPLIEIDNKEVDKYDN